MMTPIITAAMTTIAKVGKYELIVWIDCSPKVVALLAAEFAVCVLWMFVSTVPTSPKTIAITPKLTASGTRSWIE